MPGENVRLRSDQAGLISIAAVARYNSAVPWIPFRYHDVKVSQPIHLHWRREQWPRTRRTAPIAARSCKPAALATASALGTAPGLCPGCRPEVVGVAQAAPGQDGHRDHHPGPGDRQGPRRRPAPAVRLRAGRPGLRHVGDLPLRSRLQEVVRAGPGRPQADLPRHQGRPQGPGAAHGDARQAAGGARDRLRRPLLHPQLRR